MAKKLILLGIVTVLLACSITVFAQIEAEQTILASYSMDENSSGYLLDTVDTRNFTLVGGLIDGVNFIEGNGSLLINADNTAWINSSESIVDCIVTFKSFSFWFKTYESNDVSDNPPTFLRSTTENVGHAFRIMLVDGNFTVTYGSDSDFVFGSTNYSDNEWHFATVTLNTSLNSAPENENVKIKAFVDNQKEIDVHNFGSEAITSGDVDSCGIYTRFPPHYNTKTFNMDFLRIYNGTMNETLITDEHVNASIMYLNTTGYPINLINETVVTQQTNANYSLYFTVPPTIFNSVINVTGNFTLNGTSYPITEVYNDSNVYVFEVGLTVPSLPEYAAPVNISGLWNLTTHFVNDINSTALFFINQSLESGIVIFPCNETYYNDIFNLTYYDEINKELILVYNEYDLSFYDGVNTLSLNGSLDYNNNHSFCSNLPAAEATYNWQMSGLLTLSAEEYITRVFTYPSTYATIVSNNPPLLQDFYLITAGNSSTIEYTWYTTNYELIDGTLRIYRCDNASHLWVESVPISSGTAYANIELVNTPYSYEVIIGDELYQQSWNDCHIEYNTEVTYYVDLTGIGLNPVIGLFLIDCELSQPTTDIVNMKWEDNSQSTETLQGCIVGYGEAGIHGTTETVRECSNSTTQDINATIPSGTYYVKGEITQGGNVGFCDEVIQFETPRTDNFGGMGLLSAVLAVLSMALFFSTKGEKSVIGAAIGLLISWIFGIVAFGWLPASAAILFLLMIVMIGRHTRQRTQ